MRSEREPAHIDSFYHLSKEDNAEQFCQGTACFVARHLNPDRWSTAVHREQRVYCLGNCFEAPASSNDTGRPKMAGHCRESVDLGAILDGPCRSFPAYSARGGYQALEQALDQPRNELLETIELSGLRGRGVAGFPTGKKWRSVAEQHVVEKVVVANADEGDPGAYIDRYLIEDIPHRLIEAMAIAGYTVGSAKGYIYLRKEYPRACAVMKQALVEAHSEGFLGDRILRKNFTFGV
jgi:Respiratory-chain NADH dehydrogenase 51 Kd subunit